MSHHPIDPFLAAWSAVSGVDGFASRLRAYRGLQMPGRWSRERLRSVLGALLVPTQELLPIFFETFDAWFTADDLDERLNGIDVHEALKLLAERAHDIRPSTLCEPLPRPRQLPKQKSVKRKKALPIALGVLVALASGLAFLAHNSKTELDIRGPVEPGVERQSMAQPPATPAPAPQNAVNYRLRINSRLEPEPEWNWQLLGLAIFVLLGTTVTEVWQYLRRSRFRTPPIEPFPIQTALELRYPLGPKPLPFKASELDRIAYRTGLALDFDDVRLNVRETVRRTADQGGFVTAVYDPRKQTRGVSVVFPSSLEETAAVALDALIEGLRRRGVPVQVTSGAPRWDTEDLILVAVDARLQHDPPVERWLTLPHVSFVEVRDPAVWTAEVSTLPRRAYALNADGLYSAMEIAAAGRTPRPTAYATMTSATDILEIEQLGEAWPLAAACSIISPCDLGTADQMRRDLLATVPFLAFQRVRRLRGVTPDPTGWRFSAVLSRNLQRDAGAEFTKRILDWQAHRLAAVTCPSASRAEATLLRERTLVTLKQRLLSVEATASDAIEHELLASVRELERLGGDESLKRRVQERLMALPTQWLKSPRLPVIISWRIFRLSQSDAHRPAGHDPATRPKLFWFFDAIGAIAVVLCIVAALPSPIEDALISEGLEPESPITGVWLDLATSAVHRDNAGTESNSGSIGIAFTSDRFPKAGEPFPGLAGVADRDEKLTLVAFFSSSPPAMAVQSWRRGERLHLSIATESSMLDQHWTCRQPPTGSESGTTRAGEAFSNDLFATLVSLPLDRSFDEVASEILRDGIADCVAREVAPSLPESGDRVVPVTSARGTLRVICHNVAASTEPSGVIGELLAVGFRRQERRVETPEPIEVLPEPKNVLPEPKKVVPELKKTVPEPKKVVPEPKKNIRKSAEAPVVPPAVEVPYNEKNCRAYNDCTDKGRCTWQEGSCRATKDEDCRKSLGCELRGECSARAGICRAASPGDCRRACETLGLCAFTDGVCRTTPEGCRKSEGCRTREACQSSTNGKYCTAGRGS